MLGFCGDFFLFLFFSYSLLQNEWRAIGVQQSRGWVHYAIHRPEPHIMLFRRPLNYQQQQEAAAAAAAQMLPK
jgi:cyclin-dependent kinase regulatory subunit CKS1